MHKGWSSGSSVVAFASMLSAVGATDILSKISSFHGGIHSILFIIRHSFTE